MPAKGKLEFFAFEFVPGDENRSGSKGAGVGTGDRTDKERKNKVAGRVPTHKIH